MSDIRTVVSESDTRCLHGTLDTQCLHVPSLDDVKEAARRRGITLCERCVRAFQPMHVFSLLTDGHIAPDVAYLLEYDEGRYDVGMGRSARALCGTFTLEDAACVFTSSLRLYEVPVMHHLLMTHPELRARPLTLEALPLEELEHLLGEHSSR